MADNNMMVTELSRDILMFNILPRLPAKSVGRFRCVSRGWKSFLTTPHFANMQLLHLNQNHHQKLLLLSTKRPYINFCTIDCETPAGLTASRPLPFQVFRPCTIVASLHGLVCISRGRFHDQGESIDLILWNPLTSDYKTLSKPSSHDDYININYEGQFGLYYSTSNDDYKLLCVTHHHPHKVIYIYSLKSDSWTKEIQTTNKTTSKWNSPFLTPGVLLNEKLYFLNQKQIYGEHPSYFIMMFDTKTEKLREIATPTLRKTTERWGAINIGGGKERTVCMGFMLLRGSIHLCVGFTNFQGTEYHTMELWRMNGDGDGDGNWTKVLTYSPMERLSWRDKPLHIMRNGDWLIYNLHQGHVYQRDMDKPTYHLISRLKTMEINQRWKYMETLVSPNQYACDQVITPPSTIST